MVASGVLIFTTLAVLFMLHRRKMMRDKREDMDDRFQMSDYGLDDGRPSRKPRADDDMKSSQDGSPSGYGRRSRDPLHAGTEPRDNGGQSSTHLNPFDDGAPARTGNNQGR